MAELQNFERDMTVLSVESAAEYLTFSKAYLYQLCKRKQIPHINFGRHILFRRADLFNWLGELTTQPRQPDED